MKQITFNFVAESVMCIAKRINFMRGCFP